MRVEVKEGMVTRKGKDRLNPKCLIRLQLGLRQMPKQLG